MPAIIDSVSDLPFRTADLPALPDPQRLLMCPPVHFAVIDEKNPHMAGQIGRVDPIAARRQWDTLRGVFESCGTPVDLIEPQPECEDMVFCANQTLVGLDAARRRTCLLSRMKYPSRQREVPAFAEWFAARGYAVAPLPANLGFEGSGDALWHPGRGLLWGGYGHRTVADAYPAVAEYFGVPVIRLRLLSDRFYHLDTALCLIDEQTAIVHAAALEPRGLELLRTLIPRLIEVPSEEANHGFACNAAALPGGQVVIQRGNPVTAGRLRELGLHVHEVETGEFMKSGGSVFCMKMYVF